MADADQGAFVAPVTTPAAALHAHETVVRTLHLGQYLIEGAEYVEDPWLKHGTVRKVSVPNERPILLRRISNSVLTGPHPDQVRTD